MRTLVRVAHVPVLFVENRLDLKVSPQPNHIIHLRRGPCQILDNLGVRLFLDLCVTGVTSIKDEGLGLRREKYRNRVGK